jgi:hypothetical protein
MHRDRAAPAVNLQRDGRPDDERVGHAREALGCLPARHVFAVRESVAVDDAAAA